RRGRLRLAGARPRTGRESSFRWGPDPQGRHRLGRNLRCRTVARTPVSSGICVHARRAPHRLRGRLRKRKTDRGHAARRSHARAQGRITPMEISDASGYAGRADQVFIPRSEEEVAAILTRAASERVPVTVMGALTGLAGGAVPRSGWAISMAQLRKLDV